MAPSLIRPKDFGPEFRALIAYVHAEEHPTLDAYCNNIGLKRVWDLSDELHELERKRALRERLARNRAARAKAGK